MEELHWTLSRDKVPDEDVVVIIKAESPIPRTVEVLKELPTDLLYHFPFILRCASQSRLDTVYPLLIFEWCSHDLSGLAVSHEDLQISTLHGAVVNEPVSYRVTPLHVDTYNVLAFLDMVLPSMSSLGTNLVILCPLTSFKMDVVRNEALGSGQQGARRILIRTCTHEME